MQTPKFPDSFQPDGCMSWIAHCELETMPCCSTRQAGLTCGTMRTRKAAVTAQPSGLPAHTDLSPVQTMHRPVDLFFKCPSTFEGDLRSPHRPHPQHAIYPPRASLHRKLLTLAKLQRAEYEHAQFFCSCRSPALCGFARLQGVPAHRVALKPGLVCCSCVCRRYMLTRSAHQHGLTRRHYTPPLHAEDG